MSDELFPGGNQYEYEDKEDEKAGLIERLKEVIPSPRKEEEEEDDESGNGNVSFLGESSEEEETTKWDRVDRFTVVVVGIEVFFVVYLALAILGLVRFF